MFSWPVDDRQGSAPAGGAAARTEGSRDSFVVIMNNITLVDAFLDANKWMEVFPSIVSKARTIQVINHGASSGHMEKMDGAVPFNRVQGKNIQVINHGVASGHMMQAEV